MATSFKKAKPVSKLSSKPTATSNPETSSDSFYETRYNDSPTPSAEFKPLAGFPAKVSSTHTSPSKKAPPKFNIKPSTSDESDSFYNLNVDLNTMQSQGKLKPKPVVLSPQEQIELVRQRMLNQNQKQSQLPPPPEPQPTIQNNDTDNHDLSFYQSVAFDGPSEAPVRQEPLTQNPTSSNSNVNVPSNSAPPSLTSAHLARQPSAENINSTSGQSGQSGFQSGFQSGPSTQNNSSRTSPAGSSNANFTPSSSTKTDDSEFILALHQLVEVGFSVPFATIALKRCNMNVQEAIGFCLEHDDEVMQQFIDEEKAVQAARERNAQRTAQQNAMETASSASTESAVGKKPSKSLFKRMIGLKSKHDAVPTVTPAVTQSAAPHIPTVVRPQVPPPPAMNPSFQGDVVAEEDEQAVLLSLEREIPFAPTAEMQAEQDFSVHSVLPPPSLPVNRASPLLVPAPVVVSVVDSIPITPTPSAAEIFQEQPQQPLPQQRLSPVGAAQMEPSSTALRRPLSVGPTKPPKPASVRSMSSMALNQNTSGGHSNAISQMCIDEEDNNVAEQQLQQSLNPSASDESAVPSFVAPKDKISELMMSTSSDADEYGELLVLGQYNNRIATPLAREHTPLQDHEQEQEQGQEQQQQPLSVEEFRPTVPEESKEPAALAATMSVVEQTQPAPALITEQQQQETFFPSSSSALLLETAEPTADSLLVSELGYDTPHNYPATTIASATIISAAASSWLLNKPPPPLGPPPAIASAVSPAIIAGPLLMKVTSIYNDEEVRPKEEVQQSNHTVIEQQTAVGDEVVFESPVAAETSKTSESAEQKEVVTVEVTPQLLSKDPVAQKFISSDDVEPVSVAALRPSLTDPVDYENEIESEKVVLADPTDSVKSNLADDTVAAADKQIEAPETVVVDRATPSEETEGSEVSRPLENSETLLSTDLSPQVNEDTAIAIETSNWAASVTAAAVETTVPIHQIATDTDTEGNEGAEEDDGGDVFPEEPVLFAGNYRNSRSEYNLPFTAASTKPFQSSTTSEEVLEEGSEEIQVAAAVDEELEEQLEEDEAVLHPARANVSHYDIPTGNTASNRNSLVAAISSALLLEPSLSGAGSSPAVGSPPRSGAHIVNSVYVLPVNSASKSVSSESLLDNSNSFSRANNNGNNSSNNNSSNNNSSNQFTLSPRHITVSRSNSTSSAESEDNITSRAVAQNNNNNNSNGNGNSFMINSNLNNNTSSNNISNINVSRNSSQNNTTSASSGSVVGGAAPLENEGGTAVYDGEFEDPSGFEALLASQSAADEFLQLEPSAPLATSSTGNSNHNSFRNSFRNSYNGNYNNTRDAFEVVNTPPAPAPIVFSPLYHEIQRFVQTVHQREFLPIHVTDEAGGRFKAAISLKQTKLGRNESSPQGSHPNTVNIGLCSTRELARDLCYTLAPPIWSGKKESQKCQLCSVNFTMFKKGHHCRNCGHVVCNNCSNKTWPSSMVPTTYHDNEKFIRVCVGCQAGTEMFVRALRNGDLQSVLSLHEKANVNLHCPISLYVSSAHPVHCAAAGGNLDLLKWLIDVKKCSIRDNASKRMLLSGKNLSVLGVAAQAGHVDIMRYLVHNKKCSVLEITEMSILHRALHMALEAPGPMPPYIPPKGKKAEELLSEGSGKANSSAANNNSNSNSNNVVNNSSGSSSAISSNNITNNSSNNSSSINRNSVPPPPYAPPPPSSNRVNNNAAPSATSGNAAGSNSAGSNNNRVVNNNNSRNNSANSFDAGVTITPSYTPPFATSAGSNSNYSYNNINNINNSNNSINNSSINSNSSISNNASNMRQPLSLVPPHTTTPALVAHSNTGMSSTAGGAGTSSNSQQSVQQATSSSQSAQSLSSRTPSYLSNMTATTSTGNSGTATVATSGGSSAPAAPSVHTGSNNALNTMNSTQSPNRPFRQQTSNSTMDTSFTTSAPTTTAPTTTSVTAAASFSPTTTATNTTNGTSSTSRPIRQFSAGNSASSFDSAALSPASATSTGNNSVRSPNQGTSARRVAVPRALYNEAEVFIATAEVVHGDVYHSTAHSGGDDAPVAATAFLAEDVIFEVASLSRQSSGIDPLSSSPGSSLSREVSVRHIAVASPYTNVPRTELPAVPTHPVRGVNGQIPELIVESTASTAPPSRWFR